MTSHENNGCDYSDMPYSHLLSVDKMVPRSMTWYKNIVFVPYYRNTIAVHWLIGLSLWFACDMVTAALG